MLGICGDDEEQPASKRERSTMAMAMRIMRKWWYPRNGTRPVEG